MVQKISDDEFVQLFRTIGAEEMSRRLDMNTRALYERRRNLERKLKIVLTPPHRPHINPQVTELPGWINLEIPDGRVLVGGDAHIWPGPMSTAMRAFLAFIKEYKPKAVILNGDVLDFPRISRHAPIGWTSTPTPHQEIEAAQDQLQQIAKAAGRARKIWPIGNHDARFETKIASVLPELAKVVGTRLADHFPLWECCWATDINKDVVVKHKPQKGGIHSAHNATLNSGRTTISNHLHSQKVTPFTDYNGTRWGVDTGCLADVHARAFLDYTEANPLNWRAGFCMLTFRDSRLLPPELATVLDADHVTFRGEVIRV